MARIEMRHIGVSAVVLSMFAAAACGDEQGIKTNGSTTGTGGSTGGSAGQTTTGGSLSSGGSVSSGGTASTSGGSAGASNNAGASSGGSNSTGGSLSSGGSVSAGGSLSGGTGGIGPVTRVRADLVSFEGHVYRITNDFGIEGDWGQVASSGNTVTTDFKGTKACVKGTALKVGTKAGSTELDWDSYWGAVMTLSLNNNGPGTSTLPYNAPENGFAGIEVTLTGNVIPDTLLLKFKAYGLNDNFCIKLSKPKSGSRQRLLTSEARAACEVTPGAAIDPSKLENFELHIVPSPEKDVPYDLCVEDAKVVPLASGQAGAGGGG
jgi:hypothetical protein